MTEWINSKKQSPRKDIPILVVSEFSKMPTVVRWVEDGTYGYPSFFESNDEYETKEEDILYWMELPEKPNEIPCLLYRVWVNKEDILDKWPEKPNE